MDDLIETLIKNHAPGVKHRVRMEATICRLLLTSIVADGCSVGVDDGDGVQLGDTSHLLSAIFGVEEAKLRVYRGRSFIGTVSLVRGNDGWDVISDYTTSLEAIVKPANDYADRLAEGGPLAEN